MSIVIRLFRATFKLVKLSIIAVGLIATILFVPRVYDAAIREHVASQVFKIVHEVAPQQWIIGTGFVIKDSKGKTLILTNRHVCQNTKDGVVMLVQDGYTTTGKIIMMSADYDLCAITAPKGFSGLILAPDYKPGDRVQAIGHPRGLPHTRTEGEIVGIGIEEARERIRTKADAEECRAQNYSAIEEVDLKKLAKEAGAALPPNAPKLAYVCVSKVKVVYTTIPVSNGNSGSPMISQDGLVKGIIMAMTSADGLYGWGIAIPLEDIRVFLKLAFAEVK